MTDADWTVYRKHSNKNAKYLPGLMRLAKSRETRARRKAKEDMSSKWEPPTLGEIILNHKVGEVTVKE